MIHSILNLKKISFPTKWLCLTFILAPRPTIFALKMHDNLIMFLSSVISYTNHEAHGFPHTSHTLIYPFAIYG